jgi:plastocyanin
MKLPTSLPRLLHPSLLLLAAIVLAAGATTRAQDAAVVEGTVALPSGRNAPVVSQRYEIVSRGGVVAPNPPVAVVYLEGEFAPAKEAAVTRMLQRDLDFEPRLLAIRAGTRVEFPNLDDVYHNVFSYSPTKRFDLGRFRADETPVPGLVFDRPGLVTIRCDIHDHMRAVILVLATPHFVVTGTDGRFRLEGLPAGRYVLRAWIDSRTTLEREVILESGATLQTDLR